MVVHLLWIVNKSGQLIYNHTFTSKDKLGDIGLSGDRQVTVASVLYGLHGMSRQIAPVPADVMDCDGMSLVEGTDHNLHIFETVTGVKFVLLSDTDLSSCDAILSEVYQLYVDFVLKNPFYTLDNSGIGQPIRFPAFTSLVEATVTRYNEPPIKK